MSLNRITDKVRIREAMHAYLTGEKKPRVQFLVTIFSREHLPRGIVYEGARPLSAATFADGDTSYTLTNSDSDYTQPIATVKLSGIEYVETLR